MKTYDVYAIFGEAAYLVASSNDQAHGAECAERVCRQIGQWPQAFATLTRGEHTLRGTVLSWEDLKRRTVEQ